jgi:hypothetical protein
MNETYGGTVLIKSDKGAVSEVADDLTPAGTAERSPTGPNEEAHAEGKATFFHFTSFPVFPLI